MSKDFWILIDYQEDNSQAQDLRNIHVSAYIRIRTLGEEGHFITCFPARLSIFDYMPAIPAPAKPHYHSVF
jgi:hypothetical protein